MEDVEHRNENDLNENESVIDEEEEEIVDVEIVDEEPIFPVLNPPPFQHRINALMSIRQHMATIALGSAFHLTDFVSEARRLGHEPYPLTLRRRFFLFGPEALYTTSFFAYLYRFVRENGVGALFCGYETTQLLRYTITTTQVSLMFYLTKRHPGIGGYPPFPLNVIKRPTTSELLKIQLRGWIRQTIITSISCIIGHPFKVIFAREVAQKLSGETKYVGNVITKICQIANEEGIDGLYAGLVPALLCSTINIAANVVVSTTISLCLSMIKYRPPRLVPSVICWSSRFFVYFVYPFRVYVSLLAVRGSGLAIANQPGISQIHDWMDARDYLGGQDRMKGFGYIGQPYSGPTRLGSDRQFYILNNI